MVDLDATGLGACGSGERRAQIADAGQKYSHTSCTSCRRCREPSHPEHDAFDLRASPSRPARSPVLPIRAMEVVGVARTRSPYAGALGSSDAGYVEHVHHHPHIVHDGRPFFLRARERCGIVADSEPGRNTKKPSTRRALLERRRHRGGVLVHLLIDNYDFFTFNVAQALGSLAERGSPSVRNDAVDIARGGGHAPANG